MKLNIKNYLLALCSAMTILIDFQMIYYKGIKTIFDYKLILVFLLSFIVFYIHKKYNDKSIYSKVLSLFFCLFILIGNSYINFGTFTSLWHINNLFGTFVKAFGFYFLIHIIISFIIKSFPVLSNKKDIKEYKFVKIFNKHPLLFSMGIMALCWSVYYISFYPIVLSPDPSFQIKQFLGEKTKYLDYSININDNVTITNHHPVFHTALIGSFTKLGVALGNVNVGLFLYSLLQGLFMAFTLAKTITLLKEKGIQNKYLLGMLAIYAFVPMFPLYAINGNKDVYYSLFILWLLMFLFKYIDSNKEKLTIKDSILLFVILLFICLFRNNGIYIVIILFPFMLLYKRINFKKIGVVFISIMALYFSYQNVLLPGLGITKGSVRETLSIFFQQTSRYVINHEDELSEKDKKIIGNIIDYDNIKKDYKPEISDPIKNTFNKYASKEDLKDYFKVWFNGLTKHPITYIDATLNNIYGYFDIEDINWYIYTSFDSRITNLVDYHYNDLNSMRASLTYWAKAYPYIPIIGLVSNIAFSTWIIIALGIWLITSRQRKYLIFLIPSYVSLLVCIASPVNTYFRYAMPNVFAIPFIIGVSFYINKKRISR